MPTGPTTSSCLRRCAFFEDDDGNFTAYKVATAHGAGRIEFGTYEFSLADIPEIVKALRVRYAAEAP